MNMFKKIVKGACPNCKKEKIFNSKGNLLLFRMPKMQDRCRGCGYNLNKETGFFTGAMYVSYGLVVAELLLFFIGLKFLFELSLLQAYFSLVVIVVLFSTFNFRFSRIIWIYIFYKK